MDEWIPKTMQFTSLCEVRQTSERNSSCVVNAGDRSLIQNDK